MPCPTPTCLLVLKGAILCLALGWLVWVPAALRGRVLPWWAKGIVAFLTAAGSILATGVSTFVCPRCGGL